MLFDALTGLAAHLATPHEPTVTSLNATDLLDVVPAPAAQRLAAFRTVGSPLAAPAPGAGHAAVGIRPAVVRRPVDVDELRVGDRFAPFALLPAPQGRSRTTPAAVVRRRRQVDGSTARVERAGGGRAARTRRYLDRALVLRLQVVADLAKRRDRSPAGLDAARARHAVTATLHLHQRRQNLNNNNNNNKSTTTTAKFHSCIQQLYQGRTGFFSTEANKTPPNGLYAFQVFTVASPGQFSVIFCFLFQSSNFCQGKSYTKNYRSGCLVCLNGATALYSVSPPIPQTKPPVTISTQIPVFIVKKLYIRYADFLQHRDIMSSNAASQ